MKKVSKFVVLLCLLLSFPLLGQHVGKIAIEQQVEFTQFSATGNPNLLVESIVIEMTLTDMAQLNEERVNELFFAYANDNTKTNGFQKENVALSLFRGELFPLKRFSHVERQLQGTSPTLMLVQDTPKQVSVVPANLTLPSTYQNRPKALGSLLRF